LCFFSSFGDLSTFRYCCTSHRLGRIGLLWFRYSVGLFGLGIPPNPSQSLYFHRTERHRKKRGHIPMSLSGFELMNPVIIFRNCV
jgi:hypothetical protein